MNVSVQDIWKLWNSTGVYLRVHECTDHWNNIGKVDPKNCITREVSGVARATSLLRSDLPENTFTYLYQNRSFSAGWILDPESSIAHAAFSHDAWSGSNYKSRKKCPPYLSAVDYAKGRIDVSLNCTSWARFVRSRYNCYVKSVTRMTEMYHAFMQRAPFGCNRGINQVHVTYAEKDIIGVFYTHRSWRHYATFASNMMGGIPIVRLLDAADDPPPVCLSTLDDNDVNDYFRSIGYNRIMPFQNLDVLWINLFPRQVQQCLATNTTPWLAHRNVGYYLPPIGSKLRLPVIWNYRRELSCVRAKAGLGGARAPPYMLYNRTFEVLHYNVQNSLEREFMWFYHARGAGCWHHSPRTLVFHDHVDIKKYTKRSTLAGAIRYVSDHVDSVAFTHHVDEGYARQSACIKPQAGWSAIYYFQHEIVSLHKHPNLICSGNKVVRAIGDGQGIYAIPSLIG